MSEPYEATQIVEQAEEIVAVESVGASEEGALGGSVADLALEVAQEIKAGYAKALADSKSQMVAAGLAKISRAFTVMQGVRLCLVDTINKIGEPETYVGVDGREVLITTYENHVCLTRLKGHLEANEAILSRALLLGDAGIADLVHFANSKDYLREIVEVTGLDWESISVQYLGY